MHCLIKMKTVTDHGRHQRSVVELEQDACDLVLFTLHPGSYRKVGRSSTWEVDEAQMPKQSQEAGCTRVGDCAIYFC